MITKEQIIATGEEFDKQLKFARKIDKVILWTSIAYIALAILGLYLAFPAL